MAVTEKEPIERLRAKTAFERGKYFFNAGRFNEALAAHEDALGFDPTFVRALAAKSITLSALGRPREGLAVAEGIIKDHANSAYAYMARAQALLDHRTDDARRAFEEALALDPNDYTIVYNYACFWARQKDAENCRKYLDRTLALAPHQNAHAAIDPDFEPFRECAWFQELIAFKKI
jgi:tetratricopeptide (TPR) repeat protein